MNIGQFLWEGFKMAVLAIGAKRTRSVLTMLGVATGIFAISGILTMVNSLKTSVTENFASLGNTTLFVHHWPWAEGHTEWYKYINRPKVSYRDYQKLKENLDHVVAVSFSASVQNQSIQANGNDVSGAEVAGFTMEQPLIADFTLQKGRFFSEMEGHLGSAVCIIGHNIALNLYPDADPIGQFLRVGKKRLRVIGVLERKGATMFGPGSDDDKIFVAYSLLERMYNLNRRWVEKAVSIRAVSPEMVDYVEIETRGIVRAARGLKPATEDNFSINKQEAVMKQFDKMFGYFETGGWVISIFSILIGGFSIGMIMYISVRERTSEIGIQKALGSTRSFILYQFLSESMLICLTGGIIGLLCVLGLGSIIQFGLKAANVALQVYFSPADMLLGLGLSAIIGLVSGIVPAAIAAMVDPVVAIRHS